MGSGVPRGFFAIFPSRYGAVVALIFNPDFSILQRLIFRSRKKDGEGRIGAACQGKMYFSINIALNAEHGVHDCDSVHGFQWAKSQSFGRSSDLRINASC